ncbi:CPBP family intramembrane glutamic endopeptidase [Flavobacterium selenitireducens]|uniref:CPBP family intramembrane glutamic endopeptidase n=1 Tax=Flavobacterium selenitireducens TaxID=2722704 RepID=UPI00168B8720|nr:CPBP family intramembrane glutamic endopeptidase [Flavobacterium selenitireducens]MBD3580902.1 CPBP family intramembrane metalloprotease [Flavobacterium selenitireducens]
MFIEQAYKGDNTPWKVLITTFLTTGIFLVNVAVFFFVPRERTDAMYEALKKTPKLLGMVVNLLPFVLLLGLLLFLVVYLHERSVTSLTTSRPRIDFRRVLFAFLCVTTLIVSTFFIGYAIDDSNVAWNFQPEKFAVLFVLAIILFPIQIAFEEYLFRGFLMQQIGIATLSRFAPLLTTSVCFGIFHGANPEVNELGYGIMAFYIGTGFLLGIMTLMDEGIELSLGYHLANNLMAVLLISSDFSAIQSDALFRLTEEAPPQETLNEMIVSMLVTYPLLLFIFAKRYKWHDWKGKLFGKVATRLIQTTGNYENDSNLQ